MSGFPLSARWAHHDVGLFQRDVDPSGHLLLLRDYHEGYASGNPATGRGAPKFPTPQAPHLACARPSGVQSVGCERDPPERLEGMPAEMAGTHLQKGLP